MERPLCLNFRVITAYIWASKNLGLLKVPLLLVKRSSSVAVTDRTAFVRLGFLWKCLFEFYGDYSIHLGVRKFKTLSLPLLLVKRRSSVAVTDRTALV